MAKTLFITVDFLKQTTIIEQNIDEKVVRETIVEAQDLFILPLLGTALFDRVVDEVGTTVSADIKTLLDDHIQRTLKWYVLVELTDFITFRYVNKAVMQKSSDNSSPIDSIDSTRMKGLLRNKAEVYADRMSLFLCEESVKFPEFNNAGNRADTIKPKRRVYETAIYLGRDRRPSELELIARLENNIRR